jgi:hypothetical protein
MHSIIYRTPTPPKQRAVCVAVAMIDRVTP